MTSHAPRPRRRLPGVPRRRDSGGQRRAPGGPRREPGVLRRNRATVAGVVVIALAVSAVVAFAVSATGYPSRRVDLNDGGIWVTNNAKGLTGRFNKPIAQLDTGFFPPGGAQAAYSLDVAQNGSIVVMRDLAGGKLYPVDVSLGAVASSDAVALGGDTVVQIGGATIAALDPKTGKLWAAVQDLTADRASIAGLDSSLKPMATVGPDAALAVASDGSVFAVSGTRGELVVIAATDGRLGKPVTRRLGTTMSNPRITAVGSRPVVLDPARSQVVVPNAGGAKGGAHLVTLTQPGKDAVLQQSGPAASTVVVSTPTDAELVPLDDTTGKARPTSLFQQGTGAPARPVVLGDCVHAAWAGNPGAYARACGGGKLQKLDLPSGNALSAPVFRVNRGQILLNDIADGRLWIVDGTPQKVDNWTSVQPPPTKQDKNTKKNPNNSNTAREDRPPKANPDRLAGRAGRSNVLHVLDNDSDPDGDVLSITSVTPSSSNGSSITVAPDGQSVQVDTPDGASNGVSFRYTVDDGRGHNASADVSMALRAPGENQPPTLREGFKAKTGSVAAGGTYTAPVLADYRDPDSDPLVLTSAKADEGSVTATPDGRILFDAPPTAGTPKVTYTVSDSLGADRSDVAKVRVLPPDSTEAVPPTAEPDVVRGTVGTPLPITPLANDQPGSDPTDPDATLQLVGQVPQPAVAMVVTDEQSGTVTFTGARPGTFILTYGASFGSSTVSHSTIRVDVQPRPSGPQSIITTPDAAVLRGQQAVIVDVLANDFDPSGGVMSVQTAASTSDLGTLEVAIIQNRWLRIVARTPEIGDSQTVRYTVQDGISPPATGDVSVTQLPPPEQDAPPIPQDDTAVVRAGDSVTVPVLDNDSDPDGDPLALRPGQVPVTPALPGARADVFANGIRFMAPASVRSQQQVTVDYTAVDPSGQPATGHLKVTINPTSDAAHDQPPEPQDVRIGVTSGDTSTIAVPTTGVDPDGDSVTLIGLDSPPKLGRVLGFGANSVRYQAYPDTSGSDVLTYKVVDKYGLTGTAQIRIAVVPPGSLQPPVAVNDPITAAPDVTVHVDVLANDFQTPGDHVTIQPLAQTNTPLPAGSTIEKNNVVSVRAPSTPAAALTVNYGLTDGAAQPSVGRIVIRTQAGFNNSPVARDDEAKVPKDGATTTVDPLANDDDPDGPATALKLVAVADPSTRIVGQQLSIGLSAYPRNVAYTVADGKGATAIGVVHVPGTGAGGPQLRPDVGTISIKKNSTRTVPISDYVYEPGGKSLRLTTTDRIWASPDGKLTATADGTDKLVLKSSQDYVGPAAVTFEVTDGSKIGEAGSRSAVVTVPVQVGPVTPVIRCPDDTLSLVEGGTPLSVDVTTVCHVWTASTSDLSQVDFEASWSKQIAGVDIAQSGTGGRVVGLTARGAAKPGAVGAVTVSAKGTSAKSTLNVRVIGAPKPTVAPISIEGVKAGQTQRVDVRPYVTTPILHPTVQVQDKSLTSGGPATVSSTGSVLTITPGPKSHGTMRFLYTVTDEPSRAERTARGTVTLEVLGLPGQPGRPAVTAVSSRTVVLAFGPSAANGAPIIGYRVTDSRGGVHTCSASPCTITGLQNAVAYTFTVRGLNAVGAGDPSAASAPATPDQVPDAPTTVTATPADRSATVTWAPAHTEGSPVTSYQVQISPDPGSGGIRTVGGAVTTTRFTGLTNGTTYSFRVRARNAAKASSGFGRWSPSASANPFGRPVTMAAPTASTGSPSTAAKERTVRVQWNAADGNGRAVSSYTVTQYPGGAVQTLGGGATSTQFTVPTSSTQYTYSVHATNSEKLSSAESGRSNAVDVSTVPDQMAAPSAAATGNNGQVQVKFTLPADNGAPITRIDWKANGQTGSLAGTSSPQNISGLTNGANYTIQLTANNKNGPGQQSGPSNSVTPYGPLPQPDASATANGTNVDFSWNFGSVNDNTYACSVVIDGAAHSSSCAAGSASRNEGYSSTGTITVTIKRTGNEPAESKNKTASAKTGAKPPDPAKVTVSHGRKCPSGGCNDGNGNTCTSSSCAYIHIDIANFANDGSATCSLSATHDPGWGDRKVNLTGGNGGEDTTAFYGYPNTTVTATCHSANQGNKSDSISW